jgi:hypothetical protein
MTTIIIVESSYSLDSIVRGIPSSGYPFVFATRSEGVDATSSGYFSVLVLLCATALQKRLSEEVKNVPIIGWIRPEM